MSAAFVLRPVWQRLLGRGERSTLAVVLLLALGLAALRAQAMLGPVAWRPLFLLHCVLMAAMPWLLLARPQRQAMGLQAAQPTTAYTWALLWGPAAATLCFALGWALYGRGADHWFVSVANSFRAQPTPGFGLLQLHLMFTLPAIIFSPIGEELYFRGLMQRALETRFTARSSTHIEAAWFATVHLLHHGVALAAGVWTLRPVSGALWCALMFGLSWSLALLRRRGGSVWPAVLAHSAFNAPMNGFIFGLLWF
jgi:hypothetical protein